MIADTADSPRATAPLAAAPLAVATSRPAVILQVLPALVTGGVERGTLESALARIHAGVLLDLPLVIQEIAEFLLRIAAARLAAGRFAGRTIPYPWRSGPFPGAVAVR